jgi:hypothetical protein
MEIPVYLRRTFFMKLTSGLRYGAVFTSVLAAVWSSGAARADPICNTTVWGIRMRATAFNVTPGDSQSNTYDSTNNTGNCLTANSVTAAVTGANAFSSSDLSTATLGVRSSGLVFNNDVASGFAELHDRLFLTIPGANSGTVTDIGVDVTMDGTETLIPNAIQNHALKFFFGPGTVTYEADGSTVSDPGTTGGNWVSTQVLASTYTSFDFHGVIAVQGMTPFIDVLNQINDTCDNGGSCDFSHTSKINLELPPGTSYTSASTVFLAGSTSPVPEPITWPILGVGLAAMLLLRKRIA